MLDDGSSYVTKSKNKLDYHYKDEDGKEGKKRARKRKMGSVMIQRTKNK